jgi:hypothetical protein
VICLPTDDPIAAVSDVLRAQAKGSLQTGHISARGLEIQLRQQCSLILFHLY